MSRSCYERSELQILDPPKFLNQIQYEYEKYMITYYPIGHLVLVLQEIWAGVRVSKLALLAKNL